MNNNADNYQNVQSNNKKSNLLVIILLVLGILSIVVGIGITVITIISSSAMNDVVDTVKINSIKSSAYDYISGLRRQLMINNELSGGDYYISDELFEKGVSSPWGEY